MHPPLPSTTSSFLGVRDQLEVRAHRPYRDDLGCSLGMTLFYVAVYVRGGNGDPGGNDGGGVRGGGGSAAAWRWRGGGCSVGGATKARRWRTAQRRQRRGSSAEAAADSPAPSANGPTHTRLRTPLTRRHTCLCPWSRMEGRQRQWHRRRRHDGGARGNVHCSRQCAAAADDNADCDANNIVC